VLPAEVPPAGGIAAGGLPAGGIAAGRIAAGGDPVEAAKQICLRMLTTAPRTRAQLADALQRRGVADEVAGAVLSRFTDAGLIDNAAFARAWVESRHHGRGLGRRALAAELRRRGVAAEEVSAAVASLTPDDELATARRLAAQRAANSRGRPHPARVRQLMGLLARKGYPAGLAYQVVREVLAEEPQLDREISLDELDSPPADDEWPDE
jgi:regulatory protein